MGDEDIAKKPELTVGDLIYRIVSGSVSGIPGIGGLIAQAFGVAPGSPIEKRYRELVVAVAEDVRRLAEEVDALRVEDLSGNDSFDRAVRLAIQVAIRTSQTEKVEALRSAVLNAALPGSPEEAIQLTFIRLVDELTPWHLRMLKFFDDPLEWGNNHNVEYPKWRSAAASSALEHALPELEGRRDFYDQIARDLDLRGLMRGQKLHTMMTPRGALGSRTTTMGKQFLAFISSPEALADE